MLLHAGSRVGLWMRKSMTAAVLGRTQLHVCAGSWGHGGSA